MSAIRMMNIMEVKDRWLSSGWVDILFILAIMAIGVSHALNIKRGVATGSAAKVRDNLCQSEKKCFLRRLREMQVIIKEVVIFSGHMMFRGTTQESISAVVEDKIRYIISFYSAQSRPPCLHSKASPIAKISRNAKAHAVEVVGVFRNMLFGSGNSRAISRSNSRNRMATKKNRKENGIRADLSGSNPHS